MKIAFRVNDKRKIIHSNGIESDERGLRWWWQNIGLDSQERLLSGEVS